MRKFLACCGIDGQTLAVGRLKRVVAAQRPDALLFAGGVFHGAESQESPTDAAERRQFEASFLATVFSVFGEFGIEVAVLPGGHDGPLRHFLQIGMQESLRNGKVHTVHGRAFTNSDVVFSGVGGFLTAAEDAGETVIRCSRPVAEYHLNAFATIDRPLGILMFSEPTKGRLGEESGNEIVSELIDTYHPKLCIVGGRTRERGAEQTANTTVVNPGRLSDRSAALVDWSRNGAEQVELLDLE